MTVRARQVQLETPLPTGLYPALAVLLLFSGLVTTSGFAVCASLPHPLLSPSPMLAQHCQP